MTTHGIRTQLGATLALLSVCLVADAGDKIPRSCWQLPAFECRNLLPDECTQVQRFRENLATSWASEPGITNLAVGDTLYSGPRAVPKSFFVSTSRTGDVFQATVRCVHIEHSVVLSLDELESESLAGLLDEVGSTVGRRGREDFRDTSTEATMDESASDVVAVGFQALHDASEGQADLAGLDRLFAEAQRAVVVDARFRLVERERLADLIAAMDLCSSGRIPSVIRNGRIQPSRYLVRPRAMTRQDGDVVLQLAIVDTVDGSPAATLSFKTNELPQARAVVDSIHQAITKHEENAASRNPQ